MGLEWVGDGLRVGLLTALGAADLGALLTLASRWRLSLKIREGCLGSGPSLLLRALMGDETQVFLLLGMLWKEPRPTPLHHEWDRHRLKP